MIVHYINNYKYIPLWVLVRVLSFGKISKFYSLMKVKEQNAISKKYNLKPHELKVMLHNLTLIRNICAHDEKLYDIKMKNRISTTKYHEKLKIKCINGNYQFATRDLFSVVICLKILLDKEQFESFYRYVIENIQELNKHLTVIDLKCVLQKMGFPNNYKDLLEM